MDAWKTGIKLNINFNSVSPIINFPRLVKPRIRSAKGIQKQDV